MITFPIGFIVTLFVIAATAGWDNKDLYFNPHALMIVVGGTLGVLVLSNPWSVIKNLSKQIMELMRSEKSFIDVKRDLMSLSKSRNKEFVSSEELINYAQDLWRQGVSSDLFVVLLSQKKQEIEQRSADAIQSLKNLAKYPPALGMAGTVIGVVSLFQTLDQNKEKIGAALALAMTATFLGLAVANIFVMPIADRLQIKHLSQRQYLQNIYQILLLINQNEPDQLVVDELELRGA